MSRSVDMQELFKEAAKIAAVVPERAIVDSLEGGVQPEQVELAIDQAIARGLTTPRRLRSAASGRSDRVRRVVDDALVAASS